MSAVPNQPAAPIPLRQLKAGEVFLNGRIASTRKHKDVVYTVLKLPAADQFSHPSTVEVASKSRLGHPGDDWQGTCRVSGYPNDYDIKQDGEKVHVLSARNTLAVVE